MQLSKTNVLVLVASLAVIGVAVFVIRQQLDAPFEGQDALASPRHMQKPAVLQVAPIPEPMPSPKKEEPAPAEVEGSLVAQEPPATPAVQAPPTRPVVAPVAPPAATAVVAAPKQTEPAPAVVAQVAQPAAQALVAPAPPVAAPHEAPDTRAVAPVSGSLARITALRAQLEEARVLANIEAERARLRASLTPAPVVPPALQLPPMELPPRKGMAPMSSATSSAPRVFSVHGIDGSMSATVRTGKGLRSIRVGDQIEGGAVVSISRDGVAVRQGSRTTLMPFGD